MQISDRVYNAMEMALQFHGTTARKNKIAGHSIPYITHPFNVMRMCYKVGAGTDVIVCAALNHDLIEDCGVNILTLKDGIGEDAALIVKELTCTGDKAEYLKSFETSSIEALVIKILDRIDNVKDFLESDPDYAMKYCEKANVLWEFFEKRIHEIDDFFGSSQVSRSINSLIEEMLDMVYGENSDFIRRVNADPVVWVATTAGLSK